MITFIEGPDTAGRNWLYVHFKTEIKNRYPNPNVHHVYDMMLQPKTLDEAFNETRLLLELAYNSENVNFVVCGGPMYLAAEGHLMDDCRTIMRMSELFHTVHYQNVSVMSVMSSDADKDMSNIYRMISSSNMKIMSDGGKHNSYRLFMNKGNDASNKMFVDDILSTINN